MAAHPLQVNAICRNKFPFYLNPRTVGRRVRSRGAMGMGLVVVRRSPHVAKIHAHWQADKTGLKCIFYYYLDCLMTFVVVRPKTGCPSVQALPRSKLPPTSLQFPPYFTTLASHFCPPINLLCACWLLIAALRMFICILYRSLSNYLSIHLTHSELSPHILFHFFSLAPFSTRHLHWETLLLHYFLSGNSLLYYHKTFFIYTVK